MRLFLKQKVFSFKDKFSVYDEHGNERYFVEGEFFSLGKKLHVTDRFGNEVAFIQQKLLSFLPKYYITIGGMQVAEVVKEFTFFKPSYAVKGPDWNVKGDFWDHDYDVFKGNRVVAAVNKEWFTWGDTYEINIADDVDEIMALSVVLVIDACLEAEANNNSADVNN